MTSPAFLHARRPRCLRERRDGRPRSECALRPRRWRPDRNVELEGAGVRADALRGRLPMLEVPRPDEPGEAARCEILRYLKTDSFVGPCDQGDEVVVHRKSP